MMVQARVQQREVDHRCENNHPLFYQQNKTQLATDAFDQNLETWFADCSTVPGSEAFQGTVGPLQDLSLFRSQHPGDQERAMDPNFQFGVFPQVDAHTIYNSSTVANRYSMSIPAAVVDET
jgi:hypothetical protein